MPETFYSRDIWGENGQVVEEWTGIMGYTADKQVMIVPRQDFAVLADSPSPLLAKLRTRKVFGSAQDSMVMVSTFLLTTFCDLLTAPGMALTFQSAEALVQLIMGRREEVDEWLPNCYKIERVVKASS
jgi:hypothetical protein